MAFGRSNSLSINTGAGNSGSLFGQQPGAQNNTSGLFGAPATSQPAQSNSLFGGATANNTTSNTTAGSLFGGSTAQTAQPSGTTGGGLFGSNTTQTSQPTQSGGLFGGTTQNTQPAQSGGLFGSKPASTGLFGSSTTTGGGGLFGNTNNATSQPQQSGGLFGSSTAAPATGGSSLFSNLNANNNANQNQQQAGGLFGSSTMNANNNNNRSVFGMSAVSRDQLSQASLLNASTYRQTPPGAFAGRLTMGQNANASISNASTSNANAPGAVKVNVDELRTTTRFQDLIDPLKEEFEKVDRMIRKQEEFCAEIEALRAGHGANIESLNPDVALVKDLAEAVDQVLSADAQGVDAARKTVEIDWKDFERCRRVAENLSLPAGYHTNNTAAMASSGYGGSYNYPRLAHPASSTAPNEEETYDIDLIGNYFTPLAHTLQQTLDSYTSNLAAIEAHMRVIESSAVSQARVLAARRAGVGAGGELGSKNGSAAAEQAREEDAVRELAETLRGFEESILTVAGAVGGCREGVTGLTLGRYGR
ncbi:nucleoporin nup49 [Acrodontium crateriforme]|uniref:Nucleoporin nup49 n=1 Tax=Acrodontium crateriforme TaxID=150365 RepID=A0AAQ3MB25_9PEZI|nr:nucleoporin nup49 [Acrodontium crateriforme]